MQPGASFRLIVRRGPQPNQQYELTRDTVTLGRDITNDIVINDPEVSRHHARLLRMASGGYSIEDLRSTNGTFVNRQRITGPHQLSNGDLIGLGETVTLAYEAVGVGEAAATMVGGGGAPYAQRPPGGVPAQPISAPIADEGDYRPDRNRWIVIGCASLTVLFCFALLAGVIIIDYFNLYCDLPLSNQIFNCLP
ncbi:MAG TPA: FHA domain-containing protein [Chloroflexi bacterium]|nr:FHA domain-containing protein [Chloroflexota bacterium]